MAKGGPLGNGQVRPLLFVIAYLFASILDNPAPVPWSRVYCYWGGGMKKNLQNNIAQLFPSC